MGFLDRLKKRNDKVNNTYIEEQLPYRFTKMYNGNLQIDFHNDNYKENFKNFYDTTRLIVSRNPLDIKGHKVYNCAVSWYEEGDCQMLNYETGKFDNTREEQYRGVLAEIDIELLETDPTYISAVMKRLLNKSRVERYLEDGLKEKPERPCGKYVGGIKKDENGYNKFFSMEVGEFSHNSKLMIERRQKHREELEEKRQKNIKAKEDEIRRLQEEINNMEQGEEEK